MKKNLIMGALIAFGITFSTSASAEAMRARDAHDVREALVNDDAQRLAEIWLLQPGTFTSMSSFIASADPNSSEIKPQYVWAIAKKALIWALRNHTDTIVKKLPAKWRGPVGRNAKKLANLIETFEEWKEGACIIGLTSMGIPPSDSQIMCQAISFLL